MTEQLATIQSIANAGSEPAVSNEMTLERWPRLRVTWRTRILLILAGTVASMSHFHMNFAGAPRPFPLQDCLLDSLIYSVCIGLPLLAVAERCCVYITRRPFPLNWILLFVSILIPAFCGTVVAGWILLTLGLHVQENHSPLAWHSLQTSLVLSLIFGISFHLYENVRGKLAATSLQLRTKQRDEERARKLALAAQLASLESRVQPHFLFNTLNSISALIRENPEKAERMVEHLAALLRFSLDAHQRQTVPLRDELKLVNDYLQIEKARFGARLQFALNVPASMNAVAVPPFVLQTLVENSIKHAIATNRNGGTINVTAETRDHQLCLSVKDDGPGFASEALLAGHGLDNLQARLAALYGERGRLEIHSIAQQTAVCVTLPLE